MGLAGVAVFFIFIAVCYIVGSILKAIGRSNK